MSRRHRRPARRGFRVPRRLLKLLDPLLYRLSVLRLRPFLQRTDIRAIVEAGFTYRGFSLYRSIRSVQNVDELTGLAERFHSIRPRVIVEIGTRAGGTLFSFIRSNPQAELVVSIDLPGGNFGGGYSARKLRLFQQFVSDRPQTRLECLRVDSHAPETLTRLKQLLAGRPIDALFIDGDHRATKVSSRTS